MSKIYRIITLPALEIEDAVNEASENYQALSFTVSSLEKEIFVTCIMVNKRELPRPQAGISLPGMGRPPFGS
jgi:hypothetical protein